MKPFVVLVEHGGTPARSWPVLRRSRVSSAPSRRRRGLAASGDSLVEAFPDVDGAAQGIRRSSARSTPSSRAPTRPSVASPPRTATSSQRSTRNFPYVLAFVVLLTVILLTRAFRSLVLPMKAAILNLLSLAAAYGIIVFIFQQGHGSETIWGVQRPSRSSPGSR